MLGSLFHSPLERLHTAIAADDVDKVAKRLTKLDAQTLSQPGPNGAHALELALTAEEPRILVLLLQKAETPLPPASCGTPLSVLALQQRNSLTQLTALLQAGADANQCHQGQPLLHLCIEHCPPDTLMVHLSRLLQHGADIDRGDAQGRTLLEKLMPLADQALLQFLIQSGAHCEDRWLEQLADEALALQLKRVCEDLRIRRMMLGG